MDYERVKKQSDNDNDNDNDNNDNDDSNRDVYDNADDNIIF